VWINMHGVDPRISFGGAKQSGYGLEFGVEDLKALDICQSSTADMSCVGATIASGGVRTGMHQVPLRAWGGSGILRSVETYSRNLT
jgi:acyl-CoA reductase-like NAD-dependent aldehyde dehydrogenase